MPDENVKVSYRGKYSQQRDSKEKNSHTFLIVFCCVAFVMASVMYFVIPKHKKIINGPDSTTPTADASSMSRLDDILSKNDALPGSPMSKENLKDLLVLAESAMAERNFVPARDYARKIIAASDNGLFREKAIEILNKSHSELLWNDTPSPEKKLYPIKSGDTLVGIAKEFNTTIEAVQKANKLDPASAVIYPGKTLSIYKGDWKIIASKKHFRLYLCDGENIFKVYKIGTGRQNRTPAGIFEIRTKQKEPVWYSEGKTVPFGAKENILGSRWMSLNPVEGTHESFKGFGIHGSTADEGVDNATSNGCIRMRNDDIEELFSIIPYKTKVIIKE